MRRFEIVQDGFVYGTGVQWESGWVALSRTMGGFRGVECVSRMPSISSAEIRWIDPEPGLRLVEPNEPGERR